MFQFATRHWALLCISLFVSIAQVRLINSLLTLQVSADIATGVFTGRPHWRVFQSRVLSPYIIEGITALTGRPYYSYSIFICITLVIASLSAYVLGRVLAGGLGGTLAFSVFHLGFALLLSKPFLCSWDVLDIVFFLLFIHLIVIRASLLWLVVLFSVAIFNRESALFIALWLVIDPFARWFLSKFVYRVEAHLEWMCVAIGCVCMVAGIIVVELLRSNLLIEQSRAPKPNQGEFFHLYPATNLEYLLQYLTDRSVSMSFLIPLFFVGTITVCVVLAWRWPCRLLGLCIIHLLMIAMILIVGHVPETRIYLNLLPFLTFATVLLVSTRDGKMEWTISRQWEATKDGRK